MSGVGDPGAGVGVGVAGVGVGVGAGVGAIPAAKVVNVVVGLLTPPALFDALIPQVYSVPGLSPVRFAVAGPALRPVPGLLAVQL